ncbi:hypothetical protein ISF_09204 [Cordyceps fumosorosea ARSEF 2679]|uniref:Uncharacterized protein n=1 Tax=Cordyceps fumosorosea (strain ARSEF 2679) TaxID=1081104 RepID=A0A167LCJ0_CORFA|nr:hypothetical protein ISF_09204 [Cordyceps fumosorosea ARSEF 2679]OAA52926.1 hypothetical protein ISF_09204 [Cordyceps fumosorosea ARSEF 2679]
MATPTEEKRWTLKITRSNRPDIDCDQHYGLLFNEGLATDSFAACTGFQRDKYTVLVDDNPHQSKSEHKTDTEHQVGVFNTDMSIHRIKAILMDVPVAKGADASINGCKLLESQEPTFACRAWVYATLMKLWMQKLITPEERERALRFLYPRKGPVVPPEKLGK